MLYLLNTVLCLIVLFCCVKRKEYRYTIIAALILLYYIFSHLQGDVDLLDNTQAFGLLQRLTLIVLAVYTVVTAKNSCHKELDIPVAVLSCVACVFRFIRTYLFRSFTAKIKLNAAATRMLYEKFKLYYMPIESVVNISLLIVLICIAGKLRKHKATNS